jgi:hypothetical protein
MRRTILRPTLTALSPDQRRHLRLHVQHRWTRRRRRFEVVPFGACPIRLRNGRTLLMTGIQQKNISGMLGTHDTAERRMIDELNAPLEERSPPTGPRSGVPA